MEDLPQQGENLFEEFKSHIANVPRFIEEEFIRNTGNSWGSCVLSQVSVLLATIEMAHEEGTVPTETLYCSKGKAKGSRGGGARYR